MAPSHAAVRCLGRVTVVSDSSLGALLWTASLAVKVAAPVLLAGSLVAFLLAWREFRYQAPADRKRIDQLRACTKKRQRSPVVFLSYSGIHKPKALRCAALLREVGYQVVMFDPDQLWEDPAGEVIDAIVTANALLYVSGATEPSYWIEGEIRFARMYGVPFFQVVDRGELASVLGEIDRASQEIELVGRLGNESAHARFENACDAFERFIDADYFYGSRFVSDLNWAAKQGGSHDELLIGIAWMVSSIFLFLAGLACVAVWALWL